MFIECENAFNFNYDIGVSMFGISGGKIHKKKTHTLKSYSHSINP